MQAEKARKRSYNIIFKSDTPTGKTFDLILLIVILFSVLVVILESVPDLHSRYYKAFRTIEWVVTIIFTAEYILRMWAVGKPLKYILSFYGIIDFLSVIPTYAGLIVTGAQSLLIIRAIRLLRVFRILKITRYTNESQILGKALLASKVKISVFLFTVLTIVLIIGTIMYLIEGADAGFTSIPHSIYWAIVTLTTVGYGDITPHTAIGRFISGFVMILGYAIIAVPTGIFTGEIVKSARETEEKKICKDCNSRGHEKDASHCKYCGGRIAESTDGTS